MVWNKPKFKPCDKYIPYMDEAEVLDFFDSCRHMTDEKDHKAGDLIKTEVIRTLAMNEKDFCRSMRSEYRSLRNYWYKGIKPVLEKLGIELDDEATQDRWCDEVSVNVSWLVKNGYLLNGYRDLMIRDVSRIRQVAENRYQSNSNFLMKIGTNIHKDVILFIEKDSVYDTIRTIAELVGCTCISGAGKCSLAAVED